MTEESIQLIDPGKMRQPTSYEPGFKLPDLPGSSPVPTSIELGSKRRQALRNRGMQAHEWALKQLYDYHYQ